MEKLARTNPWPYDITITGAEGSYLKTKEYGNMFDMACGIAVNNLGHNYPAIKREVLKTVERYAHINVYGEFNIKEQLKYAENLADIFIEISDDNKVWFCTSGTEANELAMKLATLSTGREGFIALKDGFHGRSLGSLSLTYKPTYREPFSYMVSPELTKWVQIGEEIPEEYGNRAALFMELVQGEAGVVPVDPTWARYVSDWCKEHGVLLVIDEVQTGFGRTGTQFVIEQYRGVHPDIITLGKALGGGYPLGAVVASSERFSYISEKNPFTHLSTFGGNPVSVAAGREMYKATQTYWLLNNVADGNAMAHKALEGCEVAHLRGLGLMLGLVLDDDIEIDGVVQEIWKRGIFSGRVLYGSNTIRLYAPLNAKPREIYNNFLKVRQAVESCVK